MKKVLIVFLVFAYMNCYMGCKTTTIIHTIKTYDEFDKSNVDESIYVMSNDSTEYYFEPLKYHFYNDKIIGTAKIIDGSEYKTVSLASSEILSISIREENQHLTTVGWILGGIVFVAVYILFVYTFAKKFKEKAEKE